MFVCLFMCNMWKYKNLFASFFFFLYILSFYKFRSQYLLRSSSRILKNIERAAYWQEFYVTWNK